jgi:hypothetical protein
LAGLQHGCWPPSGTRPETRSLIFRENADQHAAPPAIGLGAELGNGGGCLEQGAPKASPASAEQRELVIGRGEHGVDAITVSAFQIIAAHATVAWMSAALEPAGAFRSVCG